MFGRRRSGGVDIPYRTWRLIRRANRARHVGGWMEAARLYGLAVARTTGLPHIWLQLGHAHKEVGDLAAACNAYTVARALEPDTAEPLLHLGHVAKLQGDITRAAACYLDGYRLAPGDRDLFRELLWVLHNVPLSSRQLVEAAALIGEVSMPQATAPLAPDDATALYDITDLIAFFRHSRVPSGIQRVQIELVGKLVTQSAGGIAIAFVPSKQSFVALRSEELVALVALAERSNDTADSAWRAALARVHLRLAGAPAIAPRQGAWLFSLSPSWSDPDFCSRVRALREQQGLKFAPFVYDLIPILFPHFFTAELPPRFARWFADLLATADHFFVISERTAQDLLNVAAAQGAVVARQNITVMPLDGDFSRDRSQSERPPSPSLRTTPFVLLVSTIEPRKNHLGAFRAWALLARRLGKGKLPLLVCVGGDGWLNAPIHAFLADEPRVRSNVVILSGVTDDGLAWLYRNCLFSLYPSFYEGWGLPVTESLCYTKVPVIANAGALPEAGGCWAVYFDPLDPAAIAKAVADLLSDEDLLLSLEQEIRSSFRPRTWAQISAPLAALAATGSPTKIHEAFTSGVSVPWTHSGEVEP